MGEQGAQEHTAQLRARRGHWKVLMKAAQPLLCGGESSWARWRQADVEIGSHLQSRWQLQKASERATFTQRLEDVLPD